MLFLYLSSTVLAQGSNAAVQRATDQTRLTFPNGKVQISLPSDIRIFTPEDFDKHYGENVRPEYAYLHPSTDSRIGISVTASRLTPDSLELYKAKLETALSNAVQNLKWHKKEIIKIGGIEWVHLEMQNLSSDGKKVMNDFYVTSFGGHPLMFTLTSDAIEFYELRKLMQKMMLSVRLFVRKEDQIGQRN